MNQLVRHEVAKNDVKLPLFVEMIIPQEVSSRAVPTRGFVAEEMKRSRRDGVVALRSPSEDAEVKSKNRCAFGSQPHLVLLSWPTVRNVVCGVDNNIRQNQS